MPMFSGTPDLLVDIEVLSLDPNRDSYNELYGSLTVGGSTIQITPNSVPGAQIQRKDQVWDGLYLEVFPGVLAAGQTEPDLRMWVEIDDQDYSSNFYVDISPSHNMFPRKRLAKNGRVLVLGESMLKLAFRSAQGAGKQNNLPAKVTGWKISDHIRFHFLSESGFTSSVFVEPPRIRLWGDVLDDSALQYINSNLRWDPTINETSVRRELAGIGAYAAQHAFSGPITRQAFQSLPGGPKQNGLAIYRFFRFSINHQPVTSGPQPYPLTRIQSLGGSIQQVGTSTTVYPQMDLGFALKGTSNALKITEFGRRPGAGAGYWGIYRGNGDMQPMDTTLGQPMTANDNPIYFGADPDNPNQTITLPQWGSWSPGEGGQEVIAGEDAAFAIAALNGQTIPAGSDETAVGGVIYLATTAVRGA